MMTRHLLAALFPLLACPLSVFAAVVHVAPSGDDANDGRAGSPVATPGRAAELVRELRRHGQSVEVLFADGEWRLDRPLVLGRDESGTADAPVVWRAEHRGRTVFTGAAALDWRPRTDGLFAATVPGTEPLPGFFMGGCMHLYEKRMDKPVFLVQDGVLLPLARYPNEGWMNATEFFGGSVSTNVYGGVFVERKDAAVKLDADPARIAKWAAETDLWAYGLWHAEWADARLKVTNVNSQAGLMSVRQDYPYRFKDGYPYRVENAVCEIDEPGEWTLERATRTLTLMKKGGGFPVAALRLNLLAVRDASDIVFDGISFECSRGDAVLIDDCRNVTLRGCSVRQTGGWGVKVTGGARCRVEGCDMWELGEGGVRLEGGDLKSLEPAEHVADNNHIRHYGRMIANYRPGVSLNGVGCRATHNLVHHSEHQAFNFNGNDHHLAYNVMHDVCMHNNDAGAIYACEYHWTKCGTVVEHNLVHMVGRKPRPTHCEAVYLDDFSSGTIVRGNILVRASSGVQMGGGHCSLVQSNVIVRTQDSPVKFASRGPGSFADRGGKGGMRDGYRGGNFRNLNAMRPSIERYPEKWNRYPHLLDNYTVRPPEGDRTDPGYWAHHQLWSEIVGNLYVCTPEFEHRYFDKVSAYNVYTNNVMTSEDPGFADYANLDFSAKKGGAYESLIAYCDFPKMGLYESPARFSPAVKFGADRSDPEPLKRMYALPVARVDVVLSPVGVPNGAELVEQMEGCTVPAWAKGRRICMKDSPIVTDEWREYAFSFVPTVDLDVTLDVRGAVGEKTQYDDFRMTGGELVNGDCSTSDGWKCPKELPKNSTADLTPPFGLVDGTLVANHDVITLQTVRVRRGRRVELRFRARAFVPAASASFKLDRSVMSDAYWAIWNEAEQNRLDSDIEKYRKANAEVEIDAPVGTEVSVEQLSHAFYFGAQIFNYGQLGKKEWNDRYKALYGTVFNSATVAFYWSNFEPLPNCPRFRPTYEDSEEFWNTCENPYLQRHWRRPATDAPGNWCRCRGVRIHGHPLVYLAGNTPIWLWGQFFPQEERDRVGFPEVPPEAFLATFDAWRDKSLKPWLAEFRKTHDEEDFGRLAPVFTANLRRLQAKRIAEISAYYGDRVDSWDVVNETRNSIDLDRPIPSGRPVVFGETGLEGGDFVYNAFKSAEAGFPQSVRLNINDNLIDDRYTNEIARLIAAGAKIDVIGMQMHMFDTNILHEISQTGGERTTEKWGSTQYWEVGTPEQIRTRFARLAPLGRPIHISEITISAPGTDDKALMIQAVVTRNLYRAWFAQKDLIGITWWNVVDGCGYAGEPTTSGLFTRSMEPKPVFRMMEDLICREWKTRTKAKVEGERRTVSFRGFKGRYLLTWTDADGKERSRHVVVK